MHLIHPYLVIQVYAPQQQALTLDLGVTDSSKTRRKLLLTTAAKEFKSNPLHATIPLLSSTISSTQDGIFTFNTWTNVIVDMPSLVSASFRNQTFRSLESVTLTGSGCKVRKIFTLRTSPAVTDVQGRLLANGHPSMVVCVDAISSTLNFPIGTQYRDCLVDLMVPTKPLVDASESPKSSSPPPRAVVEENRIRRTPPVSPAKRLHAISAASRKDVTPLPVSRSSSAKSEAARVHLEEMGNTKCVEGMQKSPSKQPSALKSSIPRRVSRTPSKSPEKRAAVTNPLADPEYDSFLNKLKTIALEQDSHTDDNDQAMTKDEVAVSGEAALHPWISAQPTAVIDNVLEKGDAELSGIEDLLNGSENLVASAAKLLDGLKCRADQLLEE